MFESVANRRSSSGEKATSAGSEVDEPKSDGVPVPFVIWPLAKSGRS